MYRVFTALSLVLIAVAAVFISSGCDMVGMPDLSGGSQTPSQTMGTLPPSFSPSPAPTDDSIISGIEDIGSGIKDFIEGKIVDLAAAPEVVSAVKDKYENVTVTGITHALYMGEQVYEVTYTDDNSSTHTVYVSADLKTITEATEPESSLIPQESISPDTSASPASTAPQEG